jgi:hypothetical protein
VKHFLILGSAFFLFACSELPEDAAYTLYRNSVFDANERIHVATFNAADGDSYNNENCKLAATLFESQPSVVTKFWCEKGHYRK